MAPPLGKILDPPLPRWGTKLFYLPKTVWKWKELDWHSRSWIFFCGNRIVLKFLDFVCSTVAGDGNQLLWLFPHHIITWSHLIDQPSSSRDITDLHDWWAILQNPLWNPSAWPDHFVMRDRPPLQCNTSTTNIGVYLGYVHSGRKLYPWKCIGGSIGRMQVDLGMPHPPVQFLSFWCRFSTKVK